MFAASPGSATLLVELGGILVGLAVLGRLAGRVGLPAIPLYLVAGLMVGEGGVVELVTARGFIESGAQIGVILLLLLLGLEYSGEELVGALRSNSHSGAVDLVLNFTPGLLVGMWFGRLEIMTVLALLHIDAWRGVQWGRTSKRSPE